MRECVSGEKREIKENESERKADRQTGRGITEIGQGAYDGR